ncbi:hypothetical protein BBBOND_0104760 [Babesia bigemina]|uniref:Uncharacterized protein n=1 Tax=Babesia bigemina TaxID=5866 RepID=A0A061D221_BABBI|nr:hypothetical protein BBBOND_0104760 [Babesia bigemina]CDR94167.1 hypothetical protein BBBOND_0104760 [Babesia bigemina]|eukprot:XP_012766353.1 hypothetical protein BBBOND_0104760 [Babesia bigemina]
MVVDRRAIRSGELAYQAFYDVAATKLTGLGRGDCAASSTKSVVGQPSSRAVTQCFVFEIHKSLLLRVNGDL